MLVLGAIFLLIVGPLMLCFPDAVYELTESWKSDSPSEPSKLYRWNTRIGGIACTLVGLFGLISFFVL